MDASGLRRYSIAVLSIVLAILVSFALRPITHQPATAIFLTAILFSAWYCGLGPSLVATALAALTSDYLREAWSGFPEHGPNEILRLGLFVFTALFIALVNQLNQRVLSREQMARYKAEEAGRLKNEFLAMISHELRTPLDAISGWARILSGAERDEQTEARAVSAITQNAMSLSHLINDLLDASQSVTGKLEIDVKTIHLKPVIEEALETMRPEIALKNIQLETAMDVSVDTVVGDPNRLKQVFCNVLGNAVKFTPEGGRIEVILRRVVTPSIHLIIRDNGIGIRRESLPEVFDRFHQPQSAETYGGLGLGLSIVRHLVELHDGKVEAYSSGEGRGATFTIELPLAAPSNEKADKSEDFPGPLAGPPVPPTQSRANPADQARYSTQ
jgi:signal transduction histidine kinase